MADMHIRLAATFRARLRGLLGRAPSPTPLLLAPCSSVHTFGLLRPIDVVFLDEELRVVKVVERLQPSRVAAARGAVAALELVAGAATLRPGDRLELVPARPTQARPTSAPTPSDRADAPTPGRSPACRPGSGP